MQVDITERGFGIIRKNTFANQPILTRPVQVVRTARRASCPTCGAKQKGNAKYCSECSTCLL